MKTTLTLVGRTFYFSNSINLLKGSSMEVELEALPNVEIKSLKRQVKYGIIESSEDISDYRNEELAEEQKAKEELKKRPEEYIKAYTVNKPSSEVREYEPEPEPIPIIPGETQRKRMARLGAYFEGGSLEQVEESADRHIEESVFRYRSNLTSNYTEEELMEHLDRNVIDYDPSLPKDVWIENFLAIYADKGPLNLGERPSLSRKTVEELQAIRDQLQLDYTMNIDLLTETDPKAAQVIQLADLLSFKDLSVEIERRLSNLLKDDLKAHLDALEIEYTESELKADLLQKTHIGILDLIYKDKQPPAYPKFETA